MKNVILVLGFYLSFFMTYSQVVEVDYYDERYMHFSDNLIRELRDSLPDGKYIVYFPTKKKNTKFIRETVSYKNYKKNGVCLSYSLINKKHFVHSFKFYNNGVFDGKYYFFDENGFVLTEGTYKDGTRIGVWKMRRDNHDYLIYYGLDEKITHWKKYELNGVFVEEGEGTPKILLTIVNP